MATNNRSLYFKKDKRVKLITKYSYQDSIGVRRTGYRYIVDGSIWAYARQLSQDQIFNAAQYGESESRLFVLNYRNDLKLYDFIEYRGAYYSITRLDTTDDYRGELFVYVKDSAQGDTPKDIQPAT